MLWNYFKTLSRLCIYQLLFLVQQVQIQKIKTYHHFLIFKIMYLSIIVLSTTSSDSEKQNISSFSDSLLQEVIDWSLTKSSNKDSTFKETSGTSTITILLNCISNTFYFIFLIFFLGVQNTIWDWKIPLQPMSPILHFPCHIAPQMLRLLMLHSKFHGSTTISN